LQNYDRGRRASVPLHKVREPLKTISALNPIRQTFHDKKREQKIRKTELESSEKAIEAGWERNLSKQTSFNIVCNTEHRTGRPLPAAISKHAGERARDFCILSNLRMTKKGELLPREKNKNIIREPSEKTKREKRDYDVIVNKYVKDHSLKIKRENEEVKRQKNKQYIRQRPYDIVLGKYRDQEKEDRISKMHQIKEHEHFSKACENRPMWQKVTEGAVENILTGEKRSKYTPPCDFKRRRHLRIYRTGQNFRKMCAEQSALDIKTHKELSRTKVRASAFDSGTKKVSKLGYDIISNKLYAGKKGRIPFQPQCHATNSIWEDFQHPKKVVKTDTGQLNRLAHLDVSINPLER